MHLMVWTQGISTMAYIHRDSKLINKELKAIHAWLASCNAEFD
ncbi:MAG: hypothetical protein OQK46_08230 [Gammaproteobacteria bacterium]|nr:hypothetical protein [Gammaproteobacteria bacterium]